MNTLNHLNTAKMQRISLRQIARPLEVKPPFKSRLEPMPKIGSRAAMARWFDKRRPAVTEHHCQSSSRPPAPSWKRGWDLACIGICLPFLLPLMLLIASWIRLSSRGPALLRQMRVGRAGKPFVMYKFRSMQLDSDRDRHESYVRHLVKADKPMIKLDLLCDAELIAGGCWLRASGLDELPQLWNVVRGEMSLVGPRPCLPGEYELFSPQQWERFAILPGLTGIWQVYGKNQASFSEMNIMDLHYVRHASWLLDLQILTRTPAALLCQMWLALQHKFTARRSSAFQTSGRQPAHAGPPQRHRQLQ